MKNIGIFGCTGSIGKNTLKVIRHLSHSFKVTVLATHSDIISLEEQIKEFSPELVCVFDEEKAKQLISKKLNVKIVFGSEGLVESAAYGAIDLMVMAITGKEALLPTIVGIKQGKSVALASKEVLVAGGKWLTTLAKKNNVPLIPIDSEHNAIFQALHKEDHNFVSRIILTASGGPFRQSTEEHLTKVTVDDALGHPSWKMGPKITIDSSTLMNKGLEVIEAHYLFELPPEKIDVVIHPQSIIHSFVEFIDGSLISVMNEPDMCYPIQYALTYPERKQTFKLPFDFTKHERLEFFPPDFKKFSALKMAYNVLKEGKSFPCFLNAANDVLVSRFLKREIPWRGIMDRLDALLEKHQPLDIDSLEKIIYIDETARGEALTI